MNPRKKIRKILINIMYAKYTYEGVELIYSSVYSMNVFEIWPIIKQLSVTWKQNPFDWQSILWFK